MIETFWPLPNRRASRLPFKHEILCREDNGTISGYMTFPSHRNICFYINSGHSLGVELISYHRARLFLFLTITSTHMSVELIMQVFRAQNEYRWQNLIWIYNFWYKLRTSNGFLSYMHRTIVNKETTLSLAFI